VKQDMIVILDLGSEENAALAREIRDMGVYSEIHPHDITKEELLKLPNVKGIILNGGPNHIVDGVRIDVSKDVYECGIPMLAVSHEPAVCERKLEAWPEDKTEVLSDFVFNVCQ